MLIELSIARDELGPLHVKTETSNVNTGGYSGFEINYFS